MIAAVGFSAGLAHMTDSNLLFDGASLGKSMTHTFRDISQSTYLYSVLMLFGLSTHATSVRPGKVFGKEIISGEDQRWYNGSEI